MNFQQLRSVREAVRRGFNLTEVAEALFTSQPGVSRQIRELEDELGIRIFARSGKRLTGLTEPGKHLLPILERLLQEAENMKRAGDDFARQGQGMLTVFTTHTQARYTLPAAVRDFSTRHPDVVLHLNQGAPQHVAQMVMAGEADIGIATDVLTTYDELVVLPCYRWTYVAVVPRGHALADGAPLDLRALARYPLISYDTGYTGRAHIDDAFRAEGLTPNYRILAMNADVIKTYVGLGMGVGIVATMAYDAVQDHELDALDAGHLFESNTTHLALRRGAYLRDYVYSFIEIFAPALTRAAVEEAQAGGRNPLTLTLSPGYGGEGAIAPSPARGRGQG